MRKLLIAGMVAVVATAGYGTSHDGSAIPPTKPASNAREAILAFAEGLAKGDETLALAVVEGTPAQRAEVQSMLKFASTILVFRDEFIAQYGKVAWSNFNDHEHKPSPVKQGEFSGNAHFALIQEDDLQSLRDYVVPEGKDEVFFPLPNELQQTRVFRVADGWLVDAGTVLPRRENADAKSFGELMEEMTSVVDRYRAAIGADDVSSDDLDIELGRAMMEVFGFTFDGPHRFDIDSL